MSGRMKLALIGYAVVAIITFGHSAGGHFMATPPPCNLLAVVCPHQVGEAAIVGSAAAAFWPLYWSWEAWSWAARS